MLKDIRDILFKRLEAIQTLYVHYTNNPFSVELTHDLRVSIRELRGLLHFIRPVIGQEAYDFMNVPLREAAQVFATIRELDVLNELVETVELEAPNLSESYYDLFNYLGKERRKEMRRTFNKTNVSIVTDAIERTRQAIEELDLDAQEDWDEYIAKRLEKKDQQLHKTYEELVFSDYDVVHDLRKAAKKNRYAAKYYKNVTSIKTKPYKKDAEKIQDELGEITDHHVNYNLITEFAEQVESVDLSELFYKIRDILQEELAE